MSSRSIVAVLLLIACEKPYSGATMSCDEALDRQAELSCGASNALHIQQLKTSCETEWDERFSDCLRACMAYVDSCDDVDACYDDCGA